MRRLVPHWVRESRAREDSRTPGRCRAPPRSRRGNEADPRLMESPQANGLRTVPECGSPLPLWLGTGRERTRRLVLHGVRESRAREDSRTPRRCRANPRSRRGNEADPQRVESTQIDGLRTVPESGSPLPLSLETGCEKTRRLIPQWGSQVEGSRGLPIAIGPTSPGDARSDPPFAATPDPIPSLRALRTALPA